MVITFSSRRGKLNPLVFLLKFFSSGIFDLPLKVVLTNSEKQILGQTRQPILALNSIRSSSTNN